MTKTGGTMSPAEFFARGFERLALFVGRHGECRVSRVPDTFDGAALSARDFSTFIEPYLDVPAAFYGGELDVPEIRELETTQSKMPYDGMWFQSPYSSGFPQNDRAIFKWFRSARNSNRAMVLVPGWPRQDQRFEEQLASLFCKRGTDVALLTVPFHQGRTPTNAYSGEYFVSSNPLWSVENFRQFVAEIRLVIRWLRQRYKTVGLFGISSGGVHAGLAAFCEDVDFYVPVMSASDLGGLMWGSSITYGIREQLQARGITQNDLRQYWSIADIGRLRAPLRSKNVLQIATQFDGIIPPEYQDALWGALGRPPRHLLPTSHFGIVFYTRTLVDVTSAFIERSLATDSQAA